MAAYYNEIDPYAAQWLRNLIAAGHIAPGDVDERSIVDVRAADLRGYRQCHFFAGIGVWSYALRRAGWRDDEEVWTGSCPCQPFSAAGKGEGFADDRHLWPAWAALIGERRPRVVFGEQVASKDGLTWLDLVHADLEAAGYACGAVDTCAAGFGAPHIRQRLYFVADSEGERRSGRAHHQDEGRRQFASGHHGEAGGMADSTDADRRAGTGLAQAGPWEDGRRRVRPSGSGVAGELADADGRHPGAERQQRSGEHRQQPQDRGAGGLEHAPSDGRIERGAESGRGRSASGCGEGDMGHAQQPGLEGHGRHGDDRDEPGRERTHQARPATEAGATNGFWSDADWLPCTDGKARPAKSGIFPLAYGIAGRVGKLRAAGNAICAPQAEEFIRAYRDMRRATT